MPAQRRTIPSKSPLSIALTENETWVRFDQQLRDLPAVPAPGDPDEILTDRLSRSLANGKRLTPAQLARIYHDAVGAVVVARATNRLRDRLRTARAGVEHSHAPSLMKSLHRQLQELLGEARETLDQLGGRDRGLEAAVERDAIAAHKHMKVLRRTYEQLRRDQDSLWKTDENMGRMMRHQPLAFIADPAAVDPEYLYRRLNWRLPGRLGDAERPSDPPTWPPLWEGEALDWLARHQEAGAWCPTRGQFDQREAEIQRQCQKLAAERDGPSRGSLTETRRLS